MTTKSIVVSLVATAILFSFIGRLTAPEPPALPPKVAVAVQHDVVASAVDSVEIKRQKQEATQLEAAQRVEAIARRRADSTAAVEKHRADSLADVAAKAETARDSAIAWQSAYLARSAEADSLEAAQVHSAAELALATKREATKDSTIEILTSATKRKDALIAQLLPLASQSDRCRILWVAKCPTRTQVFVGGAIIGAAGTLVATGKLKLPAISLKF